MEKKKEKTSSRRKTLFKNQHLIGTFNNPKNHNKDKNLIEKNQNSKRKKKSEIRKAKEYSILKRKIKEES